MSIWTLSEGVYFSDVHTYMNTIGDNSISMPSTPNRRIKSKQSDSSCTAGLHVHRLHVFFLFCLILNSRLLVAEADYLVLVCWKYLDSVFRRVRPCRLLMSGGGAVTAAPTTRLVTAIAPKCRDFTEEPNRCRTSLHSLPRLAYRMGLLFPNYYGQYKLLL